MKKENFTQLFLDSGAFSAYTQGAEINIQDYIDSIKKHKKKLVVYANLDVIGDAKGTLKNQKFMERQGLSPLPCFHMNENFKYLRYYVDKYDYIALGGVAQAKGNKNHIIKWMDQCFDVITDDDGYPKTKVHGFAVTAMDLMFRYPWWSVDSTSWVIWSRMGKIPVPVKKQGKYLYDRKPLIISVSNKSPDIKDKGSHIDNITPTVKKQIIQFIEENGMRLGKSEIVEKSLDYQPKDNEKWFEPAKKAKNGKRLLEIIIESGVSNNYILRDRLSIRFFKNVEKAFPEWPYQWKHKKRRRGSLLRGFGYGT